MMYKIQFLTDSGKISNKSVCVSMWVTECQGAIQKLRDAAYEGWQECSLGVTMGKGVCQSVTVTLKKIKWSEFIQCVKIYT